MPISKPSHGATGWDTAVNATIDAVNNLGGANQPIVHADAPPAGLTAVVGDNTTNDQPALQAQLDYLHTTYGGGTLVLAMPASTGVKITSGITIPAGVQLRSDETTLLNASAITSGAAITVADNDFTPIVGLRMDGGLFTPVSGDLSSTYTGISVAGHGLKFEKLHLQYFGHGINLCNDDTFGVLFEDGTVQHCAVGIYADYETVLPANSGERLAFVNFNVANSVRGFWATGNGTDMYFQNCSLDFCTEIARVNNAVIYTDRCHIETGVIDYLYYVTGNSILYFSDSRFVLSKSLLFKTFEGPANYGFGKARFDGCEAFFTDDTNASGSVSSEHTLSFPASATSVDLYVPWPLKGWCMVDVRFVNLDAYFVPNDDQPLITDRGDLTGKLTITAPPYATQRWVKVKF